MGKIVYLLGRNIRHSLSPPLQQAAFAAANLNWCYCLLDTEPLQLVQLVDKLRQPDCAGANVTMPYKQQVVRLLDEVDGLAQRLGAVNTIVNRGGKLAGYNTDYAGLARDLKRLGLELDNRNVVVLGAGGAAAAAAAVTVQAGGQLTVVCRRRGQGVKLLTRLGTVGTVLPWQPSRPPACDVLFNATPDGSGWQQLARRAQRVYDLNYRRSDRLAEGEQGLGMLLFQGAESFRLWTGLEPPIAVMATAVGLHL